MRLVGAILFVKEQNAKQGDKNLKTLNNTISIAIFFFWITKK